MRFIELIEKIFLLKHHSSALVTVTQQVTRIDQELRYIYIINIIFQWILYFSQYSELMQNNGNENNLSEAINQLNTIGLIYEM